MISAFFLVLGIALAILNSNDILSVSQWIINLTFIVAAGVFVLQLAFNYIAGKRAKEQFDNMRSSFRPHRLW